MKNRPILDSYTWFPYRNDSGETVPPFSIMAVSGVIDSASRATLTCEKPDSESTMYVSNGPFAVANGSYGDCCITPHRIVNFTGTLSAGQRCNPKSNDWVVQEDSSGIFAVIGIVDSARSLALIYFDQIASGGLKLIKAPSGGIPGRVGTLLGGEICDVWTEAATTQQIQDGGDNIKVYNWTTSAVCANGDRYGIAAWCNGAWYIISEDCNDGGTTLEPVTGGSNPVKPADAIDTGELTPVVTIGVGGSVSYSSGATPIP